nr:testis spermatogenesis apoptosis-related protein 3 [Homo sapiens]
MSKKMKRSPFLVGSSGNGIPSPGTFLKYLGWMMSLMGMLSRRSSRVLTSTVQQVRALPRGMGFTKKRLSFSLRKRGCSFSFTMKMMSAGMMLGPWSPSFSKVMRVPCLQPGFTSMVRILSLMVEEYPSSFSTLLEILIFLVQPKNKSSRDR